MPIATVVLSVPLPADDLMLAGRPVCDHLLAATEKVSTYHIQTDVLGGDLRTQLEAWSRNDVDRVLLLSTDRPLLTAATLARLVKGAQQQKVTVLVLATPDGSTVALCADLGWLCDQLAGQRTLAEMVATVEHVTLELSDAGECVLLDSLAAWAEAERIVRQQINQRWLLAGVQIVDPATTYIHSTVTVGRGALILPNTHLWGETTIGANSEIGPNSIVRDAQIGARCRVTASMIEQAIMEDESNIGPFGHLRKGARLCRGAHMGNFGEMKNSILGPNSKMGHFSYLGDATIGQDVNIGAGTITCNYDGVKKHKTQIGDGAFIGSDTMLVAPLEIGAGARVGAGSVVTHDVPAGAVAYGVPARVKRLAQDSKGESSEPGE